MNREQTKKMLIRYGIEPSRLEEDPWNLQAAELWGKKLNHADLRRANLTYAILASTALAGAKLTGAILYGACLINAKLPGAGLIGADLTIANLSGAELSRANLKNAILKLTDVTGADFRDVTGLTWAQLAQARYVERAILYPGDLEKIIEAGYTSKEDFRE